MPQARIVALNAHQFLKQGGGFLISIKASCVDSTATPEAVYAMEAPRALERKAAYGFFRSYAECGPYPGDGRKKAKQGLPELICWARACRCTWCFGACFGCFRWWMTCWQVPSAQVTKWRVTQYSHFESQFSNFLRGGL